MRHAPSDRHGHGTPLEQCRGRRCLVLVVLLLLLAGSLSGVALAGKREAPVRIGVLTVSWGAPPGVIGLIEGLEALGYRENVDFVIGVRFTQGDMATLPAAARELVQDGADILFCVGEPEATAAQQATTTHPIVFTSVGDPVGQGLIQSYARPDGNSTGVTDLNSPTATFNSLLCHSCVRGRCTSPS